MALVNDSVKAKANHEQGEAQRLASHSENSVTHDVEQQSAHASGFLESQDLTALVG
jgi:hypothetical protein